LKATFLQPLIRKLPLPVRLWLRQVWTGVGIFAQRYVVINNTHVTLYTDDAALIPEYAPRASLQANRGKRTLQVSLIASVKNEAANAAAWCTSILRQTRLPNEIIIVDAGSHDGTLETLRTFAEQSPIPFRVLVEPGCNIARARNQAIEHAQYPIIAVTDFGCLPQTDWLANLIAPFEAQRATRVVAGLYVPIDSQRRLIWRGFSIHPNLRRLNPRNFLPSNRSIAFTKATWRAVGGYPEWLTLTGEDTWFDRELQRLGGEWALVPEAVVEWHAPENFLAYCRKVFYWAQGDGESGLHASFYWRYVWQLIASWGSTLGLLLLALLVVEWSIAPVALWLALMILVGGMGWLAVSWITGVTVPILFVETILESVQVAGFIAGAQRRPQALARRLRSLQGMFFILSGVPIDDTGGGARCTQITLELLRQGFAVVFINKFPKYESVSLDLKIGHPNLFTYSLAEFRWERFLREEGRSFAGKRLGAIVEFPLGEFLPLVRKIRERGGVVVYDLLDAWDTSLGRQWYSPTVEREIIHASQVLIATAPSLVERLERASGRPVTWLPNAVNTHLFDPSCVYPRPPDLPAGRWTAIYTGALWGEWFDWDLLKAIAQRYSQAAIVVIGDYRGQCKNSPANLYFLGLKPQHKLPAYLAHAHVAIIPWKINAITQATSPLKVYEYLAMHLPVIAPAIEPLANIPGVWLAHDTTEFLACIDQARTAPFPRDEVERFVADNNWQTRVQQLLALVGGEQNAEKT